MIFLLLAMMMAPEPLPRRRIAAGPARILEGLTGSESRRKEALSQIGFEPELPVGEARLSFVQLDEDPELEAVLEVDLLAVMAIRVYDRDENGWWEVGSLDGPGSRIDLRQIGSQTSKEIVVRSSGTGGGGGYSSTALTIYRLRAGNLYSVFASESMSTICASEDRHVSFPDPDESERGYLVVRYTSGSGWNAPVCGKPKPAVDTCTAYRFDAATFSYVADPANSKRRCSART